MFLSARTRPACRDLRLIGAGACSLRLLRPDEQLDGFGIGYGLARGHPALVWNVEFCEAVQQYLHRIGTVLSIDIDIDPRCSYITEYFGYLRTLCVPVACL